MIQVGDPIKQVEGSTLLVVIAKVVVWICALWVCATILERTSALIDMGILIVSAPPALYLFWRKPEYGLMALLVFGSGFLAPNFVDIRLPVLGGFEARDILLMSLFMMSLVKALLHREI